MIRDKILHIKSEIPEIVTLVAVSKTKPESAIEEAYAAGQRVFGENKVQDLVRKYEQLPKDIFWHFIGHLQSNKVKYIAPFIALIHAVDSFKLLEVVNKEAQKNNRVIDCLLQFHIAEEETKFGFSFEEGKAIVSNENFTKLENIRIVGVMGMATYTHNEDQIRKEFKALKAIFTDLQKQFFADKPYFKEISMGMTQDYKIAIEEGSTMIRLGTSLFGQRNY